MTDDKIDTMMLPGLPYECPDVYLEPTNLPDSLDYFCEHSLRFVASGAEYTVVGVKQDWLGKLQRMIAAYLAECGPDHEAATQAMKGELP